MLANTGTASRGPAVMVVEAGTGMRGCRGVRATAGRRGRVPGFGTNSEASSPKPAPPISPSRAAGTSVRYAGGLTRSPVVVGRTACTEYVVGDGGAVATAGGPAVGEPGALAPGVGGAGGRAAASSSSRLRI